MKYFFYKDDNGNVPVKEFLRGISDKSEVKFKKCFEELVKSGGVTDGVTVSKLRGYPLQEIRVKEKKDLHRIIIKIRLNDAFVLLHAFTKPEGYKKGDKKVNQMIDREINVAMNRLDKMLNK
jgi:phage-related protein